jgi:hypothetical protein
MSPWLQTLKDLSGYEDNPHQKTGRSVGALYDAPNCNNITMVGTQGCGKSTYLEMLLIAADRLVAKTPPDKVFQCLLDEKSSNLEHGKSALRDGHFPPKTKKLQASDVNPALRFRWANATTVIGQRIETGEVVANMAVADLAGEDLCLLIEQVASIRNLQDAEKVNAQKITSIIMNTSAFIFIVKSSRLQGLSSVPIEQEPTNIDGLSVYSDANFKRMLDGIIRYKRLNRRSPPIRSIAFVFTAWDTLAPLAEKIQTITGTPFNPKDEVISHESLSKLAQACLPSTWAAVKSLGIPNIRFFPSWIDTEKDPDTGEPKIKKVEMFEPGRDWTDNVNSIYYSENWCWKQIDWIKEFAAGA